MANKKITIKIPRNHGDAFLRMEVNPRMKIPGLLKRIEGKEMIEYHPLTNHVKPGELKNNAKYEVFTDNADKTLCLIKNYKIRIKENLQTPKGTKGFNPCGPQGLFPPREKPLENVEEEYTKPESKNYFSRLLEKLF